MTDRQLPFDGRAKRGDSVPRLSGDGGWKETGTLKGCCCTSSRLAESVGSEANANRRQAIRYDMWVCAYTYECFPRVKQRISLH
ncbi:unnamed protein product [Pleuronectes platessa]|uniref:Uncharacterized protein n=1 Tax=Pleuronectes platessa TaxID=8262 RepID=A0A9N7Y592_PLEPL|nr:unnamed protein product [Pleuronectes platessa]